MCFQIHLITCKYHFHDKTVECIFLLELPNALNEYSFSRSCHACTCPTMLLKKVFIYDRCMQACWEHYSTLCFFPPIAVLFIVVVQSVSHILNIADVSYSVSWQILCHLHYNYMNSFILFWNIISYSLPFYSLHFCNQLRCVR